LVEPLCLIDEKLLYAEQVPVLADRLQQVVEELVEFLSQVVPDEDDVVPEGDFVLAETGADLLVKDRHPLRHIRQGSLDLLLERDVEVKLVQRVQRDHGMQQVCRAEASGADLLLILETEKDDVLAVDFALLRLHHRLLFTCLRRLLLRGILYFLHFVQF